MHTTSLPSLVAFVDPYWMGADAASLDPERLQWLVTTLSTHFKLERVYLYQEPHQLPALHQIDVPCTVRACASDALDDSFELIRAMDQDMHQLAASKAYAGFAVVSLDDRLALSIERLKSQGLSVVGVKTQAVADAESSTQRMVRVFDRMITLQGLAHASTGRSERVVSDEPDGASVAAIEQAIEQWFEESDEMARDSTLEFMHTRRGLPRHVDSRLLFLCSKALSRELSEPEKIALRARFRGVANERAATTQA
jgi:hypothetical protein